MLSSFFHSTLGRNTLVAADDTWTLLFVLVAGVATAIFLEQKYTWASKVSGTIWWTKTWRNGSLGIRSLWSI